MKNKKALLSGLMMIVLAVGVLSCEDSKPKFVSNGLDFKAVNLSADSDNEIVAVTGKGVVVSSSWTIKVTSDGQTIIVDGQSKSDELPVEAGDEVEITFTPSEPEEKEAFFTMPDGTSRKVTADAPSFRWTVPADFTSGMKIEGESHYKTDDAVCTQRGEIYLVEIKGKE
ncbi:hypothetical protein [Bacteroides acidifaciens]|uniref:hypothetical protein n=1 Tax=Bacteroides acidifaciens TaxID=85831 RepID=UPI00258B877A|nr:hypothetical protein [Bacteroides acidifaciens]